MVKKTLESHKAGQTTKSATIKSLLEQVKKDYELIKPINSIKRREGELPSDGNFLLWHADF